MKRAGWRELRPFFVLQREGLEVLKTSSQQELAPTSLASTAKFHQKQKRPARKNRPLCRLAPGEPITYPCRSYRPYHPALRDSYPLQEFQKPSLQLLALGQQSKRRSATQCELPWQGR